jgi:glycosyltransferase involved in cell wall biosynthesis
MTLLASTNPAVAIALCTYNGDRYLEQQIDSILSQTYKNITEIICVDDGSKDNTLNILNKYKVLDSRIKVYSNEVRIGYIKNFEKALTLCGAEYIALSDQDDIWHPHKIEWQMASIGDKLMIYSDNEYIDQNNNKLHKRMSDSRKLGACTSCLNLALFSGIPGHTMLVRKELVQLALPFSPKIPHDYWLAFFAAKYQSVAYIDKQLVCYRQHAKNTGEEISRKRSEITNKWLEVYEKLTIFAESIKEPDFAKEKEIIHTLADNYINLSYRKRLRKVMIFIQHKDLFLFFKKKNRIQKWIYCLKMFWRAT